jgi:hypothetical protein
MPEKTKAQLAAEKAAETKAAADAKAKAEKKLEAIELGHKKIKERAAKAAADAEARNKRRIEEEVKLMERIDKDDLSDADLVLLKRMKNRLVSETKVQEAKDRARAEKTFKVHIEGETTPCKIVKAKSKAEAIEKTENAYRAFEVADDYELKKTG